MTAYARVRYDLKMEYLERENRNPHQNGGRRICRKVRFPFCTFLERTHVEVGCRNQSCSEDRRVGRHGMREAKRRKERNLSWEEEGAKCLQRDKEGAAAYLSYLASSTSICRGFVSQRQLSVGRGIRATSILPVRQCTPATFTAVPDFETPSSTSRAAT